MVIHLKAPEEEGYEETRKLYEKQIEKEKVELKPKKKRKKK